MNGCQKIRNSRKILHSLRFNQDFQRILHEGRKVHEIGITVRWTPSSAGYTRLGIRVGRRVSTKSVIRNRLRRRIREIFRRLFFRLPPVDVLVSLHPESLNVSRRQLALSIERVINKIATYSVHHVDS